MRQPLTLIALAIFAVLVCAQNAFAQTATVAISTVPPPAPSTSVDGRSAANVSWNFGNDTTGGWSGGMSMATFGAQGLCVASGDANAKGKGIGTSMTGPNSASSVSKGVMTSGAQADGSVLDKTTVSGAAQQGNWATTGGDENFALGGNATQGQYDGTAGSKASGSGTADGKTNVSATSTPTSAQAAAITDGKSFGDMLLGRDGKGTSSASGNGGVGAMSSTVVSPDKFADASLCGDAVYNAIGGKSTTGSLLVDGKTSSTVGPTSATAASSVSSVANATGAGCGNGCGKKP